MEKKFLHICKSNMGNGFKWLDKHCPGWYNQIDTDILQMETRKFDILGQLWGNCDDSPLVKEYEEIGLTKTELNNKMSFFGFAVSTKVELDPEFTYEILNNAWRKEIHKRRPADPFKFIRRFKEAIELN